MITYHSREIGKDIIVTIIILPSHGIYIWTIIRDRVGPYVYLVRQLSEALVAFVPPMSVEDRSLLLMVVRSQTYYPEYILAYGSEKAHCALVVGSGSFWTD